MLMEKKRKKKVWGRGGGEKRNRKRRGTILRGLAFSREVKKTPVGYAMKVHTWKMKRQPAKLGHV